MPNRTATLSVLLFSFAVLLFSFKPPEGAPIAGIDEQFHVPFVTLPVVFYQVIGAIAIAASFLLIVASFWQGKSERIEKFVTKRSYTYYPGFVLFWFAYIITWLKSVAAILTISPPAWVVYAVFYFGFILLLLIPAHSFKGWLDKIKVWNST